MVSSKETSVSVNGHTKYVYILLRRDSICNVLQSTTDALQTSHKETLVDARFWVLCYYFFYIVDVFCFRVCTPLRFYQGTWRKKLGYSLTVRTGLKLSEQRWKTKKSKTFLFSQTFFNLSVDCFSSSTLNINVPINKLANIVYLVVVHISCWFNHSCNSNQKKIVDVTLVIVSKILF